MSDHALTATRGPRLRDAPPREAFYLPDGDTFVSTVHTRGPWSPEHQHGGPPSALLTRAVERVADLPVVRVTVEILRPVPIAPLRIVTRPLRPGKRVQLWEAVMTSAGAEICRATVLCIRETAIDLPELPPHPAATLPGPDELPETIFPFFRDMEGYHRAMELRFARGTWGQRAAACWMRMRPTLVAGETPTPFQRVMVAADCNNGITNVLDPRRFVFINPDLTVHVHRHPVDEWVLLDAVVNPERTGRGSAESLLHDRRGPIGRSVQSLYVDTR